MHLRQPGLIGTVDSAVSSAGLRAARLTLELTETALIDSTDELITAQSTGLGDRWNFHK